MIKTPEHLKKTKSLDKQYRGIVVDNNDPEFLQRVKCVIPGLLVDAAENLPWIYPQNGAGLGARGDIGSVSVPAIGTELVIEFPTEDVYAAFYTGVWRSSDTHPGSFNEDYPNSYGYTDDVGNSVKVNKSKRVTEIKSAAGSSVRNESDGTTKLRSRGKFVLLSEDGKTEMVVDFDNGTFNLKPQNSSTIEGIEHNINAKSHNVNAQNSTEKIDGAKLIQALSGVKIASGGSMSESVTTNKSSSIGGDSDALIAGKQNTTVGLGKTETIVAGGEEKTLVSGDMKLNLLLGNVVTQIVAGDIDLKTLAGKIFLGNAVAKLAIALAGDIELSNALAAIKLGVAGNIDIKAETNATVYGNALTKVGSSSGLTQVEGSLVTVGGPGGLPAARLGDMSIGIGNEGAPVVSTIIIGSFKVLVT